MRTRFEISDLIDNAFPIRTDLFALELVADPVADPVKYDDDETGYFVVRLVTFELDAERETLQIRDVKEQELFITAPLLQAERFPAFVTGWRRAVLRIFESQQRLATENSPAYEAFSGRIDYLMPHELLCAEVLELKRPRTAAEFEEALLASKRRLGGYLAPPPG